MAVVMSNAEPGTIRMFVGELHKGEVWTDILGWSDNRVEIGEDGFGDFTTPGVSCAVWVNEKAEGRDRFGQFDDQIYKGEDLGEEGKDKQETKKEDGGKKEE